MPELPEAEVVARQLRHRLLGAVLTDCRVGRSDIVREGLPTLSWYREACLTSVQRHGKCVALAFTRGDETRYLVAELGMTGLLLFPPLAPSFQKHTHVVMTFKGGRESELRYWNPRRFGRLSLFDGAGLARFLAKRFGLDPLQATWPEFRALLAGCRGRIKALLMHQQKIAGIGNIYASEILYRAGIHPHRLASRLPERTVRRLYEEIRKVLPEAIRDGGSSVRDFFAPDGTEGRYKCRHRVYGKAGRPCPAAGCGATIRRVVDSSKRSSFLCPRCQRKP